MNNPLISVIVPVYNVEQYLPKCVDSILGQTYTNLEVILVDDGSPDNCGKICDEYAEKDHRIRVIHKKNGGLSDARNVALDIAKGEYISFVDSDDWLHKQYVEMLYRDLVLTNADISMCAFLRTSTDKIADGNLKGHTCETMDYKQAMRLTLYQNKLNNAACAKLYKKELFEGLRFTVGRLYEDLDIFYKIYERVSRFSNTNDALYYYYCRQESILGVFNPKRLDVLDITDEILQYMQDKHPCLVKAAKDRKMSANFNILALMAINQVEDPTTESRCWNNIKQLRWGRLIDPRVRLKNKIGVLVSLEGKSFLMKISKWFGKLK